MKKKKWQASYESPEINVIFFELSDIVTTSGPYSTDSGGNIDDAWDENT